MVHFVREKTFEFAADARDVWPAIAQTNLVSEIFGAGRYEAIDELQPDGSVLRRAHGTKMRPMAKVWTEDLGEWVFARFCRQRRWFGADGDQAVEYTVVLEQDGPTTRVRIRIDVRAASPVVWLGAKLGALRISLDKLIRVQVATIEAAIARAETDPVDRTDPLAHLPFEPPKLDTRTAGQLAEVRETLYRLHGDETLPDRLIDFLQRAPDDYLGRIRPLELAKAWRADAGQVVDLFLAAHSARLLTLRWEVLCPRCRNSREPSLTLNDLPAKVHCTTCNIDYERDFSGNVELLFSPEPWLRPLPDGMACMLGASTTPHIVVQRRVEPGETLVIDPPLGAGAYHVRVPQLADEHDIDWDGKAEFPAIIAEGGHLVLEEAGGGPGIRLDNRGEAAVNVIIEELAWRSDALTGDRAIALTAFRRYCPEQLLRPGDDVRISNVSLMFTDLKGSTSLYEAIGDTAAYKLVRDHFDYLHRVVEELRGTPIKTMGDAIIAAFSDGADAVAAGIRLQTGIGDFNRGRDDGGVVLKIGLHRGACIAVTADDKLDYFGSMVNLAARLQGQSRGGDIVVSADLWDSVDAATLKGGTPGFGATQESATLRGFDEPVPYWRLARPDAGQHTVRASGDSADDLNEDPDLGDEADGERHGP